jgi:hypothetical protein
MKEDDKEDNTSEPRGLLPSGVLVAHPVKMEIIDFALD